jgi:hypothetical protein
MLGCKAQSKALVTQATRSGSWLSTANVASLHWATLEPNTQSIPCPRMAQGSRLTCPYGISYIDRQVPSCATPPNDPAPLLYSLPALHRTTRAYPRRRRGDICGVIAPCPGQLVKTPRCSDNNKYCKVVASCSRMIRDSIVWPVAQVDGSSSLVQQGLVRLPPGCPPARRMNYGPPSTTPTSCRSILLSIYTPLLPLTTDAARSAKP